LISDFFFYFGSQAVAVDLDSIGYGRIRDYKKTKLSESEGGRNIVTSMWRGNRSRVNMIIADPCEFDGFYQRVDQSTGKLV